ncbi:MAG: hypothetical protein ACK4K7_01200 [Allosphingosinicella sp.]|uniref:hypothetical protein n=1 Tax=Allosphingosinicella sp. TaxID=2823234 RepID=UPI0039590EAE
MEKLIRAIVSEVRSVVRAEIAENELRLISADLKTLQTEMAHYHAAPRGVDRLHLSTRAASDVVSRLELFSLAGHAGYMVALSTYILVLQERARMIDRRERANVRATLERGIKYAEGMNAAWKSWHDRRYEIKRTRLMHARLYKILRDGVHVQTVVSSADAERNLQQLRERDWNDDVYPKHVMPSEEIIRKWREALTS